MFDQRKRNLSDRRNKVPGRGEDEEEEPSKRKSAEGERGNQIIIKWRNQEEFNEKQLR